MLIETLEDGRTVMDKVGVQAYLVDYIGDAIRRDPAVHPMFTLFALMDSGTLESSVGSLVRSLFDNDDGEIFGVPTAAVNALYYRLFDTKMTQVGAHYYFDADLKAIQ